MTSMTAEFTFERTKRPPKPAVVVSPGRVPRVARLLALSHKIERLVREGALRDYADAARLGHVSRARMSQVMGLLNLAADIQEAILFLPPTTAGHDPIGERDVRPIAGELSWKRQREMWRRCSPRKAI